MSSTFDTKFEAILEKVAQSSKAHPWKRPMFWVAAATFVLFATIKEVLEGLFEATENISSNTSNAKKRADLKFAQNNFEGQRGVSLDLYGRVPGEYGYGNPLIPPDDTDEEQG